MRRADRLLQIIQILRRRRRAPTTADELAQELEVHSRTIYRDIATLQASRVPIEGQAGIGYVLRTGYDLPPLMFVAQELEAIVLGARMVADRGDPDLARAAADVLAKVETVLPQTMAEQLWRASLLVPHRSAEASAFGVHLPAIRQGIRESRKLALTYRDAQHVGSERVVWPLGLYFYSHVTLVCTWCELRFGFRALRADRIVECKTLEARFNPRRGALLRAFHDEKALKPGGF